MQYPQIQFYKGSLVRLATGKLKRIEDLSSEDFLQQTSATNLIDENNNSVFNSPEPTPSYDLSPPSTNLNSMKIDDNSEHFSNHDDDEEEDLTAYHQHHNHQNNHNNHYDDDVDDDDDDDDEELVDVVSSNDDHLIQNNNTNTRHNLDRHRLNLASSPESAGPFVTTSVVKDFIEVGAADSQQNNNNNSNNNSNNNTNQTVLIKFFIDSTRRIVFIEVPIERPFFVFHRGWSSWDPQKTYYKFGLKCRKLKIGDTCISLIRTSQNQQPQQQRAFAHSEH